MPDAYKSIWLVIITEYSKTKTTSLNYCIVKEFWRLNKFGKLQPIYPSFFRDEAVVH